MTIDNCQQITVADKSKMILLKSIRQKHWTKHFAGRLIKPLSKSRNFVKAVAGVCPTLCETRTNENRREQKRTGENKTEAVIIRR